MRIPETKINEISDKLSIYDVVSDYVTLTPKGGRYWGLCPFHTEKTPSFSVSEDKKMFYCFGCHKGGNMFTFIGEIENLSFPESVQRLAEKAGVELTVQEDEEVDKRYRAMMELYNRLKNSMHYILLEKETARGALNYLQERGIGEDTVREFSLGYSPDDRFWIYNFLISKKYSPEFLEMTGLFSKKNKKISLFSNRIMFPVINSSGKTVAFSGRQLDSFGGKYINTPETFFYKKRETLFGLYTAVKAIRERKEFILVEGNFDVLALYQSGNRNVVAPLGTAFTESQGKLLRRYARKCKIFFDKDTAGLNATVKTAVILEKLGVNSEVIVPEGGDDPADILKKHGPEALNKLLKYPINTFEYIVERAIEIHDVKAPEGKKAVFQFVAPYVSSLESAITRESYLKQLAEALQVRLDAVLVDFSNAVEKKKGSIFGSTENETEENRNMSLSQELYFMISVAAHLSVFAKVRNDLSLEDFDDKNARALFIVIEDLYRRDILKIDYLLERIEDEALKNLVNEKLLAGEFDVNYNSIIEDGVKSIKRKSLEKKRKSVEAELNKAELEGNLMDVKQLLSEKMYLDEELNKVKVQ